MFLGFTFGADSISEKAVEFSPLRFPRGKYLCLLSLVFDCCACYSLRSKKYHIKCKKS